MRIRTAAIGGLVLTLVTAGCGSTDEEPVATVENPLAAVQAASETTATITSYRMASTVTVEDPGDECAAALGDMVPDAELAVSGSGDDVRIEATDVTSGATGRFVDGTAYIEAAGLPDLEAPTAWVSLDGDDLIETDLALSAFSSLHVEPGDEGDFTALSLEDMLASLDIEGLSVSEVGADEVRGQPATHYSVEADPDAAFDEFVSFDVWVGADGYLRRMTTATHAVDLGGDPDSTDPDAEPFFSMPALTMTLEVWDVNAQISIEAPPVDDVTPLADIDHPPSPDSLFPTELMEACLPTLGN